MMSLDDLLSKPELFSEILYEKMKRINPGIEDVELYEFRYGLDNLVPAQGNWSSISLETKREINQRLNDINFYRGIQIKPLSGERIVLEPAIVSLTNMLFVGLVSGEYPIEWVRQHFYFDIRGFYFLHRTHYFTAQVIEHLGGQPYLKLNVSRTISNGGKISDIKTLKTQMLRWIRRLSRV
jgi:hypothetical protein